MSELTDQELKQILRYQDELILIAQYYECEDYDMYEKKIESVARKYGKPAWQVEDDATDVRMFGIDVC